MIAARLSTTRRRSGLVGGEAVDQKDNAPRMTKRRTRRTRRMRRRWRAWRRIRSPG
jgi:hypothetical protein